MVVRVLFFGVLKDMMGRAEELREIPENTTLGALFDDYSGRFETLRDKRSSILLARNREFSRSDAVLSENDEVAFLPPVSGGSVEPARTGECRLVRLTRAPIDSQSLARELQRPEDGAVVVFEGIVRNNTNGRITKYLDYECYEEMALAGMERIGKGIANQFAIGRVGMVHRLGRLQVGEASVSVIATAPHRRPAFEAALEGINRLKREVPIWKKEYFLDGALWVDGEWDETLLKAAAGESNASPILSDDEAC
ncbi:MAG TPA: molybdenum cofactor biosynthesis protein MoaE [Bryobacteraceae bacterium]|jgi:molybdopterin synthase catalytic subunit|nr:molybdenum cofactor biosynthesis protein MoaE [Bryobacteraceae bacterium]